jgi:TonB family protein
MIKKFRRPARREIIAFAALLAVLSIALLTESQPLLSRSTNEQNAAFGERSIAVSIGDNGEVAINGLERTWDQFETELQSIYEGRSNKNMFIYASRPEAQRDDIDRVLDVAKRAGVKRITRITNQGIATESSITVSISDTGEIAINGLNRTLDKLESELRVIYNSRLNKNMFISASQNVPYIDVVNVVDIAKRAGVIGIALLTESGKPREQVNQDANSDSVSAGNLTDGLQYPEMLANTRPDYTKEAREARIEGLIVLKVVIRKDGLVDNVEVVQGLGYGLDEAAIEAVMTEWRFKPATLNGEPIDHPSTIEFNFALR